MRLARNTFAGALALLLATGALNAQEMKSYRGQWQGEQVTLPVTAAFKPGTSWGEPSASARPLAVYLQDIPVERIGTDSDDTIRQKLLDDGLLVVNLDCSALPADPQKLTEILAAFHKDLPQTMAALIPEKDIRLSLDDRNPFVHTSEVFYLPAGYTLTRSVPYWNIEKHGAPGSLERIVSVHNNQLPQRYREKHKPVDSVYDIRNDKGEPLDFNLYLDIIHPSGAQSEGVPLVVNFASQSLRMHSFRPSNTTRVVYPIGFLLNGFAWAIVDHNYIPLSRHQNFRHFSPYGLDDQNVVASASASIRHLRANQERYNLNGRIGAMGHSKASESVTRLLDPNHQNPDNPAAREHRRFPNQESTQSAEPQPWAGFSSELNAGFASMGNGIRRFEYVTPETHPVMTAVGRFDKFKQWDVFPPFIAAARKNDVNYVDLWMEELAHEYPSGVDTPSGIARHALVQTFFEQHLMPEAPLEILWIYPHPGATDIGRDGQLRFLPADDELPKDMKGISPFTPITVRFVRSVDAEQAKQKLSVRELASGKPVQGTWSSSLQDSQFHFAPSSPLAAATDYEVVAEAGIADRNGKTTQQAVRSQFRTASGEPAASVKPKASRNEAQRGNSAQQKIAASTALAASAQGTPLLSESWANGNRNTQQLPASARWFTSGPANTLTATQGALTLKPGESTRYALAYFTAPGSAIEIPQGQALRLEYTFSFTGIPASKGNFLRIGLFNSQTSTNSGKRITGDNAGASANAYKGYTGYVLNQLNIVSASSVQIRKRKADSSSSNLMTSTAPAIYTTIAGNARASAGYTDNTIYNGVLQITRKAGNSVALTASVSEGGRQLYNLDVTDNAEAFTSFDTVAFAPASSTVETMVIHSLSISLVTAP